MSGGHSGSPAIVPGDPDASYLIEVVTAEEGAAEMPPAGSNAKALNEEQVQLLRRWITEGAINDSLKKTIPFSQNSPPLYSRQPNITAIDYSSDGKWLAVNGLHEVLLFDAENLADKQIAKRLIGLSSRIESLQFSPDGKWLAASGGNPGEFGEVQVWDVETGKLQLSKVVSHDTVYGVNWSPDGKQVAFGCTDTTIRVIDAMNGQQLLYQGAHDDWIRDTVFSVDGSQLVSVGRDMTCKLYEVPTQRFVDNITSITPGVLKGGIASVARHPSRDEIVIGGADGIPKVYRMNRITKRVIGDDANLVRLLPPMSGRIQSVAVSQDGRRIAAASSLNGHGAVHVYSYEFDPTVSDELKAILAKLPGQWSAQEREKVNAYNQAGVQTIAEVAVPTGGLYGVAFHPSGQHLAAAGADGAVRILETETGRLIQQFQPVPTVQAATDEVARDWRFTAQPPTAPSSSVTGEISGIVVSPSSIHFQSPTDYVQLVIQAVTEGGGSHQDITHVATVEFNSLSADAPAWVSTENALVQPVKNGSGQLTIKYAEHQISVPVTIEMPETFEPEFRRDVNPILTKLGCNAGTCHGSADGKMGFKLSLRGYDPIFDLRAFTDDMGARRTNLASPSESLMLAKPAAMVPHSGGQLIKPDEKYYQVIREWIRAGAKTNADAARVVSVELIPKNPVLNEAGDIQQMRLVATWSDGTTRDVTREGFIEMGGMETAEILNGSSVRALRRGETPVLGRYEGAFTATTLTVMGKRDGFVWVEPETWSEIDRLVAEKWQRMKIQPSEICEDHEFIRRLYLDLTGLPPSPAEVQKFVAETAPTQQKRARLIDELIGSDSFVEHWANKWADLLQVNRKYLGTAGAKDFRNWIREQVRDNRPYDQFTYDILTATGSNRENPAASYYKIHRSPVDTMENTTHLFLATRFNCNKCHDHPFERWTQDQYFETAAYFAQVSLKTDPASGDQRIGGTAVEGAKPLYEIIADGDSGDITHDRTGEIASPAFPFDCDFEVNANAPRRAQLASWITSPDNPYFASSYVNRLWGYLLGAGLIEPLDDIRAGNPPTNPKLLEYLRTEFIDSGFDAQHILRLICNSRTYQLSIATNEFNADDAVNYSHAMARRLPAEVLFDSIHFVTGSALKIPGVPAGTRAAALPDSGARLPSGFLSTLGRPARESVCECERSSELQLGSVLALVSGPDISRAIDDPQNELAKLVTGEPDDRNLVSKIYMRILNRTATEKEINQTLATFSTLDTDHEKLTGQRNARQTEVTSRLPQLEKDRAASIAAATQELNSSIQQLNPDLVKKEAAREKAIAATRLALDQYSDSRQGLDTWLDQQRSSVHWYPVAVSKFETTTGRPFSVLEDRSILLQRKSGVDVYSLLSQTDLTSISTVRLELITHKSLQRNGPGLADHGNLVLSEFEIEVAHPDQPDQWQKVEIESAVANFEQPSYLIGETFDGNLATANGWALAGHVGKTNWATFQLKSPIGYADGTRLRFKLHQNHDANHQIGRFRISLSRNHAIGLGLAEFLVNELAKAPEQRNAVVNEQLLAAFRKSDSSFRELEVAHNQAKVPLVVEPEIKRLREKLARVSQPLPEDSLLVQLNKDVAMSRAQLSNSRLTAAQDLAWALINSPAFLFNH
ncbi:MAG: DUF1549 domain-containing protein [Pirellulaceae bacterium]|nr:DUF1549 domain-containing protein [Pirellulaceae bacterium]